MASVVKCNAGGRRKSAIRSGLFAVSAAAAGLCSSMAARADITNGFSGFASVNFAGQSSIGNVGYSATGSTFTLTDNRGSEATSGFYVTPQNITSFDCTYTYVEPTATANVADGMTFVIQNSSSGTTALGAGGGGLGYTGIGNSAALAFNIYSGYTVGAEVLSGGTDNNAYTSPTNINLRSGDPIQVTLEYFNNTLTANYVDLQTNASYGKIYTGVNIPSAVGSSAGYVGFTGGTGGQTATQQVSNFTFVSGTGPTGTRLYQPIGFTGYNQQGVISVAGGQSSVTATMDAGTAKTGDTWYEKGWNTYAPSTGLPASGSTFTSQYDSSHIFQMPNYSANDVVLLSTASKTATMNFTAPAAYSTLSFLESCGNGPSSFKVTINYADGAPSTSGLSVITPDWFNGIPSAWYAQGRDTLTSNPASAPDNYNTGSGSQSGPNLYEEDLILPDNTDPIASLSLTFSGTNTGTNMMIFAVSGVVANSAPIVTYTGAAVAGKFDTSTINFSQNSGGTLSPVAFSNGDQVIFDDTAVDTVHNITVATVSGGIKTGGLIFNNTTATAPYTFTGAGIGGPGGITVNGGGTVILDNPNTFSGGAYVNSGTLIIGTGGTLASSVISVSSGATFQVSGGTLTGSGITLSDTGTVNYAPSSLSLAGLSGNGALTSLNATGTSLTLTGSGTFSGTLSLGTGSVTVNANGSTVAFTSSNTYSGGTYLKAGALQIGNSSSLGSGTLYLQGGSFGATGGPVNFSNFITGGALVVPSGSSLLEISGTTNNFTGPVVIQTGAILQLDSPGSIGGINGANAATGTISVASGGTLTINDNSGTLGLTGGVSTGAPITLVLSGSGVGNNGALTTLSGSSGTWAGNINASGPATIAPGAGSTLTLTGAITGTGPVAYASNRNDSNYSVITLSPPSASANTYTGESQVSSDYGGAFATLTVGLGNNNGFSTASGLNLVTGGTGEVSVELNGYNQSIQYLTGGAGSNFQISNTAATISTLTVSNGNSSSGLGQIFSAPIIGNIAVVKNGSGNQTLNGNNTYSGGTLVNAGTLTIPNSASLGSAPVTLAGGTLALTAPSSISGFGSSSTGGSATVNSGVLTLNPTNGSVGSAFTNSPLAISDTSGFTTSFVYNPLPMGSGYAVGGMAFNIISSPVTSGSGNYGNGGSYKGISIVFNVEWDVVGPSGTQGTFTGLSIDGATPTAAQTNQYAINPFTGEQGPITVTLNYSNGTLTETLQCSEPGYVIATDVYSPTSITFTYSGVDIAQDLGGLANGTAQAYVGFTGANNISAPGSNAYWEEQQISNYNFSGGGNVPVNLSNNNGVIAMAGSSVIQVGTSTGQNTLSLPFLNLSSGAKLAITQSTGSTGRVVLSTTSLTIAGSPGAYTAQLDIGGNDLDLPGSSLATITSMLKQGYANGAWNGNGIASSAAANDSTHLTALGVILNDNGSGTPLYGVNGTISSTFDGATPGDGDILVKYTYYGDANLDGAVDGSDYSLIDYAYITNLTAGSQKLTGWQNGDFNYDGVIDGSDYALIDNAFNQQGGSLGSNPLAQISVVVGGSAVPEPASLSILAIGSIAMLGRRRRVSRTCS